MNEINRERFEAWLFSQEPSREFDYFDVNGGCAICSFVRETTHLKEACGGSYNVWHTFNDRKTRENKTLIPTWMASMCAELHPELTIANMQARYISLFGNPRIVDEQKGQSNERQTSQKGQYAPQIL